MDDWVKPLTRKEASLIDLISQHIIEASNEATVHKVWKLQESKRLDTFKVTGNLMFGMDLFDVIDLTDKSKVILRSKKRGAPSTAKYALKNDVIEISPNCNLRIVDLSEDTLTVNLILNFGNENVSIKGEALEMKFIQMKII